MAADGDDTRAPRRDPRWHSQGRRTNGGEDSDRADPAGSMHPPRPYGNPLRRTAVPRPPSALQPQQPPDNRQEEVGRHEARSTPATRRALMPNDYLAALIARWYFHSLARSALPDAPVQPDRKRRDTDQDRRTQVPPRHPDQAETSAPS